MSTMDASSTSGMLATASTQKSCKTSANGFAPSTKAPEVAQRPQGIE